MTASKFTFRPGSLSNVKDEHLKVELDRYVARIYDSHSSLNSTAVKAPSFGTNFATQSGIAFVVGGSLLNIPTGLSSVDHVVVSLEAGNGVPLNLWVVGQKSKATPGAIDIYVWMPTSSSDNTPVPNTGANSVHWYATGQAETTT